MLLGIERTLNEGRENSFVRFELNWIWPKIYSKATATGAAKDGALAAFFVSGVTGLFALLSIFRVFTLASPLSFVDAVVFAFLGFMVRRMSRTAAVAGLALFVVERVFGGIAHGVNAGIGVLAIVLLFAFISGVRGTFAYHHYRLGTEREATVEPR